jgi:hypothetical protein
MGPVGNLLETNIAVGVSPVDLAVNTHNNTIYVANQGSNSVSVLNYTHTMRSIFNGLPILGSVLKTIPLGYSPSHIVVNPSTDMVYVTSRNSNTMSVINGTSNTLVLGMTFNTNLPNLGDIYCNGKKVSTNYIRYDIGTHLDCEAETKNQNESITGFKPLDNFLSQIHALFAGGTAFTSWSGDVPGLNQTNPKVIFTVYKYGTLAANFINTPPMISETYLTTFLAIGIPVIGAAIYKKRDWLYKRHKGYLNKYTKKIDIAYEISYENREECLQLLGRIRTQVIELYLSEQIDKSDFKILEKKLEEYVDRLNSGQKGELME